MMFTDKNIIIRKGFPEDAQDGTNLIWLSDPVFCHTIFGSGAKNILQNLFRQRKNLFSFEHSYFIEVDGKKAGMIFGYDGKSERGESCRTGLLMIKYMKMRFFARIPSLLKALNAGGRVEDSEYYISNLAVYPEFRGKKLGTNLLVRAEEGAKSCGAEKMSLDVAVNNQGAIRLYNRLGYSIMGKPRKEKIGGRVFAFFRMSKKIDVA